MTEDAVSRALAQEGLRLIEDAILRLLEANPQGLGNIEIADSPRLLSSFKGGDLDCLTYSVLGLLLEDGRVVRSPGTGLFIKS